MLVGGASVFEGAGWLWWLGLLVVEALQLSVEHCESECVCV